jgi:hypothetical protein
MKCQHVWNRRALASDDAEGCAEAAGAGVGVVGEALEAVPCCFRRLTRAAYCRMRSAGNSSTLAM